MKIKVTGNESIKIGTSNIVLPVTKNHFPAAFQNSSRLTYYGSLFNTLEVNSSFYKVPLPSTFERWSAEVQEDFVFTVKLWRNITHNKALAYQAKDIEFFMRAANCVQDEKKGCLLIQFPASITIDYIKKIDKLLQCINGFNPLLHWRLCVEFRHNGWYAPAVYDMLNRHHSSLVLHDMPKSRLTESHTTADTIYLRFHGIEGDYKGSYAQDVLKDYAGKIKHWQRNRKQVYVYFNNTIGNAFENAQCLRNLLI